MVAVVNSDSSRNRLAAEAKENVWIGMGKGDDGKWETPCGEEIKYASWDAGQPNGGDENCVVQFPSKKWHDYHCTANKFAFVCQIKSKCY